MRRSEAKRQTQRARLTVSLTERKAEEHTEKQTDIDIKERDTDRRGKAKERRNEKMSGFLFQRIAISFYLF